MLPDADGAMARITFGKRDPIGDCVRQASDLPQSCGGGNLLDE